MHKHYFDYFWKEGKPYGRQIVDPDHSSSSYKIIVDPYYKRFSIEKYNFNSFISIIYDSILLDFRHLTLKDQQAWQREALQDKHERSLCLLRNQEDRAILFEELRFEGNRCRECLTRSIHGINICLHRMYYSSLNDPFNGVVLFDMEKRPVMMKTYESDPITDEFTQLIIEEWNMQTHPQLLQKCLT